jgi:hypothetical protein
VRPGGEISRICRQIRTPRILLRFSSHRYHSLNWRYRKAVGLAWATRIVFSYGLFVSIIAKQFTAGPRGPAGCSAIARSLWRGWRGQWSVIRDLVRPIRGATLQLVDSSNAELATTVSGEDGSYSFPGVDSNRDLRIRVRAELKKTGSPSWDVEVRDNVVDPDDANPPLLSDRPLYAIVSDFNTGNADLIRNLTARTGWDGSSYSETRAAAPFAILDTIYSAMQLVLSVDPDAAFAPLDAFWSINNTSFGTSIDVDSGELTTSFYSRDTDSLFLLGDASVDTEEFDDHVIVHEWGHYFEDNFSRTDSVGGPHGIGDLLDSRLAFGEGWASALAGIALDDPLYCDTGRPGTTDALLALGLEDGFYDPRGWYDEVSVLRFIYDLWDTTDNLIDDQTGNEIVGAEPDNGSIGFGPTPW